MANDARSRTGHGQEPVVPPRQEVEHGETEPRDVPSAAVPEHLLGNEAFLREYDAKLAELAAIVERWWNGTPETQHAE